MGIQEFVNKDPVRDASIVASKKKGSATFVFELNETIDVDPFNLG